MIGTGYFQGLCVVPQAPTLPGPSCAVIPQLNSYIFAYPVGALLFLSGTWERTVLGQPVLHATGDAPYFVVRPSARTRGIGGYVECYANSGTTLRLYYDVVTAPGPTYVELKYGASGYLKAVSGTGTRTVPLNVPTGTSGIPPALAIRVCQYPADDGGDDHWYLTALTNVLGLTISVPCSQPHYGRMGVGLSAEGWLADLYLYGAGKTVDSAGTASTAAHNTCDCGSCAGPDCGCQPAAIDVTFAGFGPPYEALNGVRTFLRRGNCTWGWDIWQFTASYSGTTLTITLADSPGFEITGSSVTATGRGCDKISGVVFTTTYGITSGTLTVGTASE